MGTATPSKQGDAVTAAAKDFDTFRASYTKLKSEIQKVIVGHEDIIDGVVTCLLADGHALLEGVPGLGKTILVRTLANVVQLEFSRIQFTPDLMPSDIIGTNLIVEGQGGSKKFEFQRGPVFTNILLADEINRATPKTQSALLQAMAEQQVTVGTNNYNIEPPYFVLATQNPLEQEGTYPLPEAQLDRFMFKLNVAFPKLDELDVIMDRTISGHMPEVQAVVTQDDLLAMRQIAKRVPIASHIQRYALTMLQFTHPTVDDPLDVVRQYIRAGSSPRGGQAILKTARIHALIRGETAVGYEDIVAVLRPSLRHRILLNFEGEAEGVDTDQILAEILERTPKS